MSSCTESLEDPLKGFSNIDMMKDITTRQDAKEEHPSSGTSHQSKVTDTDIEKKNDMSSKSIQDKNMERPLTSSCFMDVTMTDSQQSDKLQRKEEWKADQNIMIIDGKGDTECNNSLALSVGSRVEAKDFEEIWYPAHIVELDYDEMEVLVHYDNSSKKYDEWINVSSPRLRPWTSFTESLTKEQVHKKNDSERVTKEKDGQQSKHRKVIEQMKQEKDETEEKSEDKLILRFKVGERCLARWKDNRRFLATVVNDLDNGKYEIIFDDGFPWTCSVSRLLKVKPHTDVSNVSSSPFDKSESSPNLSNLNVSSGGEGISTSSPVPIVPAASVPYHKHLFDPTRDYLGPKSERRELKRKLNIKDLFNIGTTKRRRTKVISQPKKKQLELKVMLERKRKGKSRRRAAKTSTQNDLNNSIDLKKIDQENETPPEKALSDTQNKTDDILAMKKEVESIQSTESSEGKDVGDLLNLSDECMDIKLAKKEKSHIGPENKFFEDVKSEDSESDLITLEDIKKLEIKPKQTAIDIEEEIVELKDDLKISESGEKLVDKADIKKENKMQENVCCENKDKIFNSKNWKLRRTRFKKARKLRLLREKRVKKEVEEVKNQLVEMKKQVEEMKKQVRMKSVEALSENSRQEISESKERPEASEEQHYTKKQPQKRELLPGEWCCKWVNGHPQGIVSEVGCETKVDGSTKHMLPRRSVQVEDRRLPSGWTKHLVRRSFGSSAGQWNVVLVSPENKRFHTKAEVKTYMHLKRDDSLKKYERGLCDFGTHRRLSRKLGWDIITCKLPAVPLPSKIVSASSPIVSKRTNLKRRGRGRKDKMEAQSKGKKSLVKRSKMLSSENTSKNTLISSTSKLEIETLPSGLISNNKLVPEDGCVYVGSLKVQVIENLLRCPAEGCMKNFRNTTLLQMHIKHYHRDLRKLMGATPKVLDLAYARTLPLEMDKFKQKPEIEHKTPRSRMSRSRRLDHDPNAESISSKPETILESTPSIPIVELEKKIPRSLDSPKLRKALIGHPIKRPKVLLPVRNIEMMDDTVAESPKPDSLEEFSGSDDKTLDGTEDDEEIKSNNELPTPLDVEQEISSHTVTKPVVEREKKKRVKALLPVQKVKPMSAVTSEEDEWCISDLETRSSCPGSGTPDSRLDKSVDTPPQPTSLEYGEEIKDDKMYITETGERIKIVHMKREEIINCHCGFREEDGLMIQCELCLCWQHALCHNIQRESEVPEKYTCSICLNPRRGRRSQRFLHDQDRLYEGLLPGARPDPALRRAHDLSGNLLRFTDALHALRVKYYVATKKGHPKLYLWAKDWENGELNNSSEARLNNDYLDLNNVITDIGKENLPIKTEDLKNMPLIETRTPEEDGQRREGQLVTQLSSLLSSPSGPSLDIPISTTELEHLAKSVQEYGAGGLGAGAPAGPQPEAAIEDGACRERLLRHVQRCQAVIDARLDSIEAQVAELESQDPSFEDDETADYFPRTKQTIQMLLRDMDNMEELGFIS